MRMSCILNKVKSLNLELNKSTQFLFACLLNPDLQLYSKILSYIRSSYTAPSVVQQKLGNEKSPFRLNKTSDSQRVYVIS